MKIIFCFLKLLLIIAFQCETLLAQQSIRPLEISFLSFQFVNSGNDSLNKNQQAYGLSISKYSSIDQLSFYTKTSFSQHTDTQSFQDNNNSINSIYKLTTIDQEIGSKIKFLKKPQGFNVYVNGGFFYRFVQLDLKPYYASESYTQLKSIYQNSNSGYSYGIGFQYTYNSSGNSTVYTSTQINYLVNSQDIVNVKNFNLNLYSLSLGLGF